MSMITENVAQIRSRIAAAARAAGRDPADIRLCAATKMNQRRRHCQRICPL